MNLMGDWDFYYIIIWGGIAFTLAGILFTVVLSVKRRYLPNQFAPLIAIPAFAASVGAILELNRWIQSQLPVDQPTAADIIHPENAIHYARELLVFGCVQTAILVVCYILLRWRSRT